MNITVSYTPEKDAENHVRAIFDNIYNTYGRTDMKERLLAKVELDTVKQILEKTMIGTRHLKRLQYYSRNEQTETHSNKKQRTLKRRGRSLGTKSSFS